MISVSHRRAIQAVSGWASDRGIRRNGNSAYCSLGRSNRASIDWFALLPTPNVTKWLTIDLIGKRLVTEPAVAEAT
jgi:hypothetical protein